MSRLVCAFTYDGEAVAKGRPRVTTRGGFARTYTPRKTAEYETTVGLYAMQAMREAGAMACDEAVGVTIDINRCPPASWSKKKRAAHLGQPITCRPDIDNQAKSIIDGLNGVAFLDDCQIARLIVARCWGLRDVIKVEVRTL